ncbi:hypothetical protein GCM10020000_72610 [Streptomyces olivoverticillatus]
MRAHLHRRGRPAGECLRLNPAATRLWRTAVGRLDQAGLARLAPPSRSFLQSLLERGVLAWRDARP